MFEFNQNEYLNKILSGLVKFKSKICWCVLVIFVVPVSSFAFGIKLPSIKVPSLSDVANIITNPDPCKLVGARCLPQEITDPVRDITEGVTAPAIKLADDIVKSGTRDVKNLGTAKLITIVNNELGKVSILETIEKNIYTTVEHIGKDIVMNVSKTGKDIEANYSKGWRDTLKQSSESFNDAVDVVKAAGRYQERTLNAQSDAIKAAERRLREGKVVDAAWGIATEPLQSNEENFFKATQESSVINQAAASAAAVYGGPGGAAAYSAWHTYRVTGDANLAFKAGVLSGITSQLNAGQETLTANSTLEDAIRKASLAGAAGGVAVAAQGGDEAAITNGFLKSSGSVLIQYGKSSAAAYSPPLADGLNLAECISAKDIDCVNKNQYVKDAKGRFLKDGRGNPIESPKNNLDPASGIWTSIEQNSAAREVQQIVTDISTLENNSNPKLKLIILDKKWVLTTTIGKTTEIEYGKPTVVLTAVGEDPEFNFTRKFNKLIPINTNKNLNQKGNYLCYIGKEVRPITTTVNGKKCKAIYLNSKQKAQILHESDYNPESCIERASYYANIDFKSKGLRCIPN
ncbi:hypothetical protein [Methylotenera sp. N17]|uniref:hypothetical protein n=1 Tax=Methylotenera sp. N17 TaxID=1502761 RepID=UPI000645D96B|nr:hypothetical protein [Methylotenera sp. N17]